MLPREQPRRQNSGRGNRGGKVDRPAGRHSMPTTRSGGNAPVLGTVIGFSPAATTPATNDRLLFTFQVLIGYTVEVQVKAGSVYQGIFSTAQIENSELHVVLQMAKLIRDTDQNADSTGSRKPIKELVIRSADLVSLFAKDVRMGADDLSRPAEDSLNTDSAISRGRGGLPGRELQKWTPEASDDLGSMLLESDPHGKSSTKWDQFAANQQLFGTDTSYNEDLYTTKLDASVSGITVEEAERLAAEIQRGNTSSRHVAEERGGHVDDSGMDEEDLYSAVGRQPYARATSSGRAPADDADAANDDMFGEAGPGSTLAGLHAGPARTAWTGAGTSVAVVAGSTRGKVTFIEGHLPPRSKWGGLTSEKSFTSQASASQPIDMRAEHNKVRTHLQAGLKKDRSSPYGTPGAKSPLSSPLIADATALDALNLNPGSVKFDSSTLKSFQEYKLKEAAKKAAQQRSPRISPSAISMSTSETSLREEDSDIFAAAGTPSKQSPGSQTSAFTPTSNAAATSAAPAVEPEAAAASASVSQPPAASDAPVTDATSAPGQAEVKTGGSGLPASQAKTGSQPAKSKLNPNAPTFSLNVNAPSFTPASKPAAPSTPPAPSTLAPATSAPATSAPAASGPISALAPAPERSQGAVPDPLQPPRHQRAASASLQSQGSTAGSLAEERQSRTPAASQGGSRGVSRSRPGSSPNRRGVSPGGPSNRRMQYPQSSEQMWAQSQGMHMGGQRPSGPMAMHQGMPMMQAAYIPPGSMPGMMHGMPMMGPQQQMMGYMGNMRPYNEPTYGMMQGQNPYMMYGPPQMNPPAQHMRPPAHSQGYQGAMHYGNQQAPMNQAMSGSLDPQNSSGQIPYPNSNKR